MVAAEVGGGGGNGPKNGIGPGDGNMANGFIPNGGYGRLNNAEADEGGEARNDAFGNGGTASMPCFAF